MSKTVKKLLLFFIVLCVILLIVFVVELFIVNRGVDPDLDYTQPDTSAPDSPDRQSPPPQSPPDNTTPPQTDTPASQDDDVTPVQTADGTLFEIPVPGGKTLTLIADEERFEHEQLDFLGNMFIYKSPLGEPATLEISIIEGMEAVVLAPSFLDNYIDYIGGEFFSGGESRIAGSELSGELVIASKDGQTYEAWLMDVEGGVLVVVLNYWDDTQKAALYQILDTLELSGT